MSALFVTGAGTEIGKTYVSCALLKALRAQGLLCDALKPVLSGFDEEAPKGSDPALLLEALGKPFNAASLERIAPLRFRAPLAPPLAARAEGREINYHALLELCRTRIGLSEGVLLIEGAGGVMSPLTETHTFLDLAEVLRAPVVFVSGSYLGALSHALTGLQCLAARNVRVAAVIVSESTESVGLQETRNLLESQRPDLAVLAAGREEADAPAWAIDLARAIAASA
jgi:dethiobiotin synthetase